MILLSAYSPIAASCSAAEAANDAAAFVLLLLCAASCFGTKMVALVIPPVPMGPGLDTTHDCYVVT